MRIQRHAPQAERGQIIVLFVLAITTIIAMVGLVLDGGDTFAQRRVEQNGADLAAMAGANAYMNTVGTVAIKTAAAQAGARASATKNGFTNGSNGVVLGVSVTLLSGGASVQVGITKPHPNAFSRVVGQASWNVSVDATAIAGLIDTAYGAAPWTMHIDAFNGDGTPKYTSSNPQDFGEANGDFPINGTDIAWTDFNGNNNVNSSEVSGIISGSNVVIATFDFDQYLGQHNQGNHTTLYDDVDQHLAGRDVAIPIVGPGAPTCTNPSYADGCFKGWAMFHVISAQGGSSKTINGYFLSDFKSLPLTVGECNAAQQAAGTCGVIDAGSIFGQYLVRLTD